MLLRKSSVTSVKIYLLVITLHLLIKVQLETTMKCCKLDNMVNFP